MKVNTLATDAKSGVEATTQDKNAAARKSVKDARDQAEKLAVADVDSAVPHFLTVRSTEDLKRVIVSTDESENSSLTTSALKVLKKIKFDAEVPSDQFIEAHITKAGNDPETGAAKLVVDMSGEEALKRYFKTGFWNALTSWLPRLIGGANKSIGIKWLKQDSGINFFDPSGEHSKMDNPKRVKELLASGRYAVSVVYKADENGNFTKEPEAIALIDVFHKVMDEIEQNIDSAPKEMQDTLKEKISEFKQEQVNSYCMINTALLNPNSKSLYDGDDSSALRHRESLLSAMFESMDEHTNFIVPNEVFASADAKTHKYQYDQLPDMNFVYANRQDHNASLFSKTGTLVSNRNIHREKIPSEDLSEIMAMAMISEHIADPTRLDADMSAHLGEHLQKAGSANYQAFEKLNAKLGFNQDSDKAAA